MFLYYGGPMVLLFQENMQRNKVTNHLRFNLCRFPKTKSSVVEKEDVRGLQKENGFVFLFSAVITRRKRINLSLIHLIKIYGFITTIFYS